MGYICGNSSVGILGVWWLAEDNLILKGRIAENY